MNWEVRSQAKTLMRDHSLLVARRALFVSYGSPCTLGGSPMGLSSPAVDDQPLLFQKIK